MSNRGSRGTGLNRETEPLLSSSSTPQFLQEARHESSHHSGSIRARRSSRSPMERVNSSQQASNSQYRATEYTQERDTESQTQSSSAYIPATYSSSRQTTSTYSTSQSTARRQEQQQQSQRYEPRQRQIEPNSPLLEIPEEIYAVRKAALQVLKPLTSSWLVVSIGFAVSVLLGMARWTNLMSDLPYWFILLPSWFSHVGLLWCHVRSARALSKFITEANENRQRPDSTDHIDRTEYLPLLQRSLKFGLKTGLLSFCTFIFEVLIYMRIAKGALPLGVCFIPLWVLIGGGILDGIVCKTQHFVRVLCWLLIFVSMLLTVLRVDHGREEIRWRIIVSPIVAVLSLASAALIYIVYGHQVGYYRLTESQLTAGILYSMSALILIVLVVVIGEVMPLARPVEIETRILVVVMAPLVVCLTGMGGYAVSRDEFSRLLLYGGQSAVHPMKLRWESNGWTSVATRGVTVIPMFGEVR